MVEWPERFKEVAYAWLEKQWNEPNRTDHYLMRIAQRIHQQWSKGQISLKDEKIEFVFKKSRPLTKEERIAQSKAIWMGGTDHKGVVKDGN